MLLPPVFPPVSISTLSFDTVGFEALLKCLHNGVRERKDGKS